MSEINRCIECGTAFLKNDDYKLWNWFTCEVCGTDYNKKNGKWIKVE